MTCPWSSSNESKAMFIVYPLPLRMNKIFLRSCSWNFENWNFLNNKVSTNVFHKASFFIFHSFLMGNYKKKIRALILLTKSWGILDEQKTSSSLCWRPHFKLNLLMECLKLSMTLDASEKAIIPKKNKNRHY